ncbi:uncharacterized protein F5891DRAFT_1201468 [Suillus fuscotomentosus]|uniref:Uncharacterized protein n=1 Tax=Suillus fuscotomentosus TaxID=1912939 RepID=A0AAD4DNA9_9AGAM|nr:uncharacterized protein F5891DRAFT_1201468 [Suillus fuscotomentosus]KAG1885891.1 hypothetical protein F5891DRAFT_1201468 [Suillus fuscotomentosus]
MSDNGETSQTATSSGPTQMTAEVTMDLSCVRQCSELISQYKLGQCGKADTILELRDVLLDSPAIKGKRNLNKALEVFIRMLNSIDSSKGKAAEGTSDFEETESEKKQPRDDSESEDIDHPSAK